MRYEVTREKGTAGVIEETVYSAVVEAPSAREAIAQVVESSEARIDGSDFSEWVWRDSVNGPILAHPETVQGNRHGDYWLAIPVEGDGA